MQIEIAYAESQRVIRKVYELAPGARVADALELAALDPDFAEKIRVAMKSPNCARENYALHGKKRKGV